MSIHASVNGCDSCAATGGMARLKTPREYLARARRLQAQGSPAAPHAMRQAALALGVARAAQQGRHDLVQKGIAGLHALATAEPGQAEIASLQTRLSSQAAGIRSQIQSYVQLASGVANIIAGASGDRNVIKVVRWIDAILLGRTPPEQLDIAELRDFCRVWNSGVGMTATALIRAVGAAITAASRGSDARAASVAEQLASYIDMATSAICGLLPQAPPAPGAADPGNCNTLMCGVGQEKVPTSDGANCECRAIPPASSTPIDPVVWARTQWRAAMAGRLLAEGIMKAPGTSAIKDRAVRNNCAFACRLEFFERRYLAAKRAAGQPATIEAYGTVAPASSRARRFVDASTSPSNCDCQPQYLALTDKYGDDGSGDGDSGSSSTAMLVGGAAVVGLAVMFAMR